MKQTVCTYLLVAGLLLPCHSFSQSDNKKAAAMQKKDSKVENTREYIYYQPEDAQKAKRLNTSLEEKGYIVDENLLNDIMILNHKDADGVLNSNAESLLLPPLPDKAKINSQYQDALRIYNEGKKKKDPQLDESFSVQKKEFSENVDRIEHYLNIKAGWPLPDSVRNQCILVNNMLKTFQYDSLDSYHKKTIYDFTKAYNDLISKGASAHDPTFIENLYYLLDDFERAIHISAKSKSKDTGYLENKFPYAFTCDASNTIVLPPPIDNNSDDNIIPVQINSVLPDSKSDSLKEEVWYVIKGLSYDPANYKSWTQWTDCVMILEGFRYKIYLKDPRTGNRITCIRELDLTQGSQWLKGFQKAKNENIDAIPFYIVQSTNCK